MTRFAAIALVIFLLAPASALVASCGPARDPSLDELSSTLRAVTPPEQRTALDADLDALAALSRENKLGVAERDAMIQLFRSATGKDGALDDDERALIVHLMRDVVAGGGSLHAEKTR